MFQRLYEGDDPTIAISLYSLAAELQVLGKDVRARELSEQAQGMFQRLYRYEDLDVASFLSGLAIYMRRALGDDEKARELDEQAQAMRQRLA